MAPRPPGPGPVGAPTKTDNRHFKAAAKTANDDEADAYRQGIADAKAGTPNAHRPLEASLDAAYDSGLEEGAPAAPGPSSAAGGSSSSGGGMLSRAGGAVTGEGAAGFVLGMIGYAVGINFLRGGPGAVRGWFAAKFLNKPYGGPIQAQPYQPVSPSAPVVPATPVGPPVGAPPIFGKPA